MIVSISSNNFGIKLIQAKPGLNFNILIIFFNILVTINSNHY